MAIAWNLPRKKNIQLFNEAQFLFYTFDSLITKCEPTQLDVHPKGRVPTCKAVVEVTASRRCPGLTYIFELENRCFGTKREYDRNGRALEA
jgi:hypothetical protein